MGSQQPTETELTKIFDKVLTRARSHRQKCPSDTGLSSEVRIAIDSVATGSGTPEAARSLFRRQLNGTLKREQMAKFDELLQNSR